MKFKLLVFTLVFVFSCSACAQPVPDNKNSTHLYTFGKCSISIDLVKDGFVRIEGDMGKYYAPLITDSALPVPDPNIIAAKLICATGADEKIVQGITGGYEFDKQWIKIDKDEPDSPKDYVPFVIQFSGENWLGILSAVSPSPSSPDEDKPSPLQVYSLLIDSASINLKT